MFVACRHLEYNSHISLRCWRVFFPVANSQRSSTQPSPHVSLSFQTNMIELRKALSNLFIDKHPFSSSFDGNQVSTLVSAGALIYVPCFSPLWKYVPRVIKGRILAFWKIKTASKTDYLTNKQKIMLTITMLIISTTKGSTVIITLTIIC